MAEMVKKAAGAVKEWLWGRFCRPCAFGRGELEACRGCRVLEAGDNAEELVRAVLAAVGLRTPGYPTDERQWVVTLYKYHRDNLLFLLRALGYGAPAVPPFQLMNTGDWVGEVALMLADENGGIVPDRPNIDREELERRLEVWFETEVKPALLGALGLPECGLPRPGQEVYVPTSAYIDSPWRDVDGGLATVDRVEIELCPNPYNTVFVRLRELPGRRYNWRYLSENQERWAREYAGRRARPAAGAGFGSRSGEGRGWGLTSFPPGSG